MENFKEIFNGQYNDNCTLDTTPYDLHHYQIQNTNMYEIVKFDNLQVGIRYRYCFTKNTYPESIRIISNEGNNLIITNPYNKGKQWIIEKSECTLDKNIFYKKNYYSSRANYLNLKEGLILTEGKSNDPISRYLFDDENVIKEICSFISRT